MGLAAALSARCDSCRAGPPARARQFHDLRLELARNRARDNRVRRAVTLRSPLATCAVTRTPHSWRANGGPSMTLKRILVPLDGSALAERALAYATAVARLTGAELLLLRVTNAHTLPGVDPRERQLGAIEDAQQYIDSQVARVAALGIACQGVVRFGKTAECRSEEH